jgi:hypothetical protein
MPIEQIDRVKAQHGWTVPFYASLGTSFSDDCGVGSGFLLNAFLRDGDEIYRTYTTGSRGVDRLMFVNNIQDLSVYGRQEDWEDSPEGGHSSDPRSFPSRARSVPLKGRLRRLPGVVDRTVAQLLHRLLQVGTAVAIGGDAIGHDEGKTNGLHGSTHQLGGITWAKPRGQLSGWHGAGIRTLRGEIADPQGHHRRRRGGPNPRA